jgi:hypothetical protein
MSDEKKKLAPGDLRPRKIQRVLRILVMALTLGLLVYGVMRFSLVEVPRGYTGGDYAPGESLIIDRFYSHGRALEPGDTVVFTVGESRVLGQVLAVPGKDVPDWVITKYGLPADIAPRDHAFLVVPDSVPSRPDGMPPLHWVPADRIAARVLCPSPF